CDLSSADAGSRGDGDRCERERNSKRARVGAIKRTLHACEICLHRRWGATPFRGCFVRRGVFERCHVLYPPPAADPQGMASCPATRRRMLFTDALVVTGILSNGEIATRSSIGPYFFLPAGENERLIETAGF